MCITFFFGCVSVSRMTRMNVSSALPSEPGFTGLPDLQDLPHQIQIKKQHKYVRTYAVFMI